MTEELRPDKSGYFLVSRDGQIYRKGKLKTQYYRTDSYYVVSITIAKKQKHYYVHRLIAESWIDNPLNYPYVNHRDSDKQNNSIDNLEWCTHQQNMSHYFRSDKYQDEKHKFGQQNSNSDRNIKKEYDWQQAKYDQFLFRLPKELGQQFRAKLAAKGIGVFEWAKQQVEKFVSETDAVKRREFLVMARSYADKETEPATPKLTP